jgi:hypothetical protein
MIILSSASDKLQVVTAVAGEVDVHASWLDNTAGAVSVGRSNTAITAAATTDVVLSPGTGVQRNVRTLHIRNKGTDPNDVVVRHTDGSTIVEIYKQTVPPDGQFQYNDGNGFSVVVAPS